MDHHTWFSCVGGIFHQSDAVCVCDMRHISTHRCHLFPPGGGGWYIQCKLNGTPAASSTSLFTSLHHTWYHLYLSSKGRDIWAVRIFLGGICLIFVGELMMHSL